MAQAQYDKFIELRKSGVDAKSARTQAYGEAPIAPTTPTPTGGTTLPIAPTVTQAPTTAPMATPTQPLAEAGDTVTGVNGEKFVQANNIDMTTAPSTTPQVVESPKIEAPTAPKVETPTYTTPNKTESTVDFNQAKGREQDIMKNLNSFKAINPDPESIKKSAGYYDHNISTEKKAMIDAFVGNIDNSANLDTNSIYNMISTGQVISPAIKSNPYYKQAEAIYKKVQNFQTMTPQQLVTSLNSGTLLPGTSEYEQLIRDPVMKGKIEMARIFSNGTTNQDQVLANKSQEILSQNSKVAQFLEDGIISLDEYNQMTNNPDVVAQAKLRDEKLYAYNTKAKEMEDALKKAEQDFAGSPFLSSIKADISSGYRVELDYLKGEADIATGTLTELKGTATALYNANLDNYVAYRDAQIGIDTNRANNALEIEQNQAEFDQKIAQQAQLANDPMTAIQTVMDEYKKLGIPFTESIQSKLAKFQSSGLTIGQYVDKMIKDIQAKPEYMAMQAYQMSQYAPETKDFSFANLGEGRIAIQNPNTGEVSFATAGSISSANAPTSSSARYLQIPTGTDVGVQCGQFARTLCGMNSTPGGNSLDARKKSFVDATPVAGGMILFTGSGYDKTYGHIAAIESVNPDGTLSIVESNLNNDNKVTRRTIQANDPAIHGFYNNTPLATQGIGTSAGYTPQKIELLAEISQIQSETEKRKALEASGLELADLTDYKAKASAGLIPPTEGQRQSALGILSSIQGVSQTDWTDAVGKYDYSRGLGLQDASDASVLIENLRDSSAFNNLGVLKGPMSDKDIMFLKSISSKLDPAQSNAQFEKNIVEMYNIAARKAGVNLITKLSDIPKERIIPGTQTQPTGDTNIVLTGASLLQKWKSRKK